MIFRLGFLQLFGDGFFFCFFSLFSLVCEFFGFFSFLLCFSFVLRLRNTNSLLEFCFFKPRKRRNDGGGDGVVLLEFSYIV